MGGNGCNTPYKLPRNEIEGTVFGKMSALFLFKNPANSA
jgi:hypothetical protein